MPEVRETFVNAVRAEIEAQSPNEPEELDEEAVKALAYYLSENGYEQFYELQMYFLYDLLKFTRQ